MAYWVLQFAVFAPLKLLNACKLCVLVKMGGAPDWIKPASSEGTSPCSSLTVIQLALFWLLDLLGYLHPINFSLKQCHKHRILRKIGILCSNYWWILLLFCRFYGSWWTLTVGLAHIWIIQWIAGKAEAAAVVSFYCNSAGAPSEDRRHSQSFFCCPNASL